jgi:dTMP kinase
MLIAVEGLHSAGKSTCVAAIAGVLRERGLPVVTTEWNSSPPLGPTITRLKVDNLIGPVAMVLMEAADLAYRFETRLRDALANGAVVISDRYHYSTLVRGISRGVDPAYIRSCFSFSAEPDIVFHLRCAAEVTLARREAAGLPIGGHMSGEDYRIVTDRRRGFVEHQNEMAVLYDTVLPDRTVSLDATLPQTDLQAQVLAVVGERLMSRSAQGAPASP